MSQAETKDDLESQPDPERQLLILRVDPRLTMDAFSVMTEKPTGNPPVYNVVRIDHPAVPKNARVRGVYADPGRVGIAIIIQHESLSEVPPGEQIPAIPAWDAKFECIQMTPVIQDDPVSGANVG